MRGEAPFRSFAAMAHGLFAELLTISRYYG
jgi:hypothetical protein